MDPSALLISDECWLPMAVIKQMVKRTWTEMSKGLMNLGLVLGARI